jgi:ubiquinone/menaquinone biosynthesis C-methylase UbiE
MQAKQIQRVDSVKKLFEHGDWYLQKWRCAITIRAEAVREFVGTRDFQSVLDIGCGDGSISTQLLKPGMRLTLNDLSSTMLSSAASRMPQGFSDQIEYINEDFSRAMLSFQPFDLIICVGVLAHVDSPVATIQKINSLLTSGGTVIVECTDDQHPVTKLAAAIGSLRGKSAASTYSTNRVVPGEVVKTFESLGYKQVVIYRHVLPMLGLSRFFSQAALYRMVRTLCGYPSSQRNAWLGNHYIFQFLKEAA